MKNVPETSISDFYLINEKYAFLVVSPRVSKFHPHIQHLLSYLLQISNKTWSITIISSLKKPNNDYLKKFEH